MKTTLQKISRIARISLLAGAATLAACGGGSDSTSLTFSGVAATGLAIAGASVSVQCVAGTGTATTNANGAYSVTFDGQGPCLVTLTQGNLRLQSIARQTAAGSTIAIANITPFSDAIVKALMQAKGAATPEALVTTAIPSNANLVNAVDAAFYKINAALAAKGQALLPVNTDLLGQPNFVARTATTAGDALDQALDALVEPSTNALSATLLSEIKTVVSQVVPPNPTGATSATD